MPELTFVTRWPDGRRLSSYSPSLVVQDYLTEGQSYELADFVNRSEAALTVASDRVQAKYGMPCSAAAAALVMIKDTAGAFGGGQVIVESVRPHAG